MAGFDLDLFVIGGGSGGVRAARVAAEGGARVALAEESRMGGTCVIRGCVPKKLMVFASTFARQFEDARAYGWELGPGRFDWPRFRQRLDGELTRLEGIYRANLQRAGVRIFDQRATLAGPQQVLLADGTSLSARTVLIATGGRPSRPEVPGAELAMVSDDLFLMDELPRRLLIVGGGFIGCEFACVFAGMGVEVTQFYRGAQVLRGFDGEAAAHVAEGIRRCGVDLRTQTDITRLERATGGIRVRFRGPDGAEESALFDAVLLATGRHPNTRGLGLEGAGVALGADGSVQVDPYSRSSVPSVWAVGDVTARITLTPVAIREGAAFVETALQGTPLAVDHENVAQAIFTRPEFGTIGLGEEEAAAREPVDVYSAVFRPMQTSFIGADDRVLFKLVVSAAGGRVLGCHIVAPGAGEMIQIAAVAVKMGATKAQFDAAVAVHPTMAEELVLMKSPTRRVGQG